MGSFLTVSLSALLLPIDSHMFSYHVRCDIGKKPSFSEGIVGPKKSQVVDCGCCSMRCVTGACDILKELSLLYE